MGTCGVIKSPDGRLVGSIEADGDKNGGGVWFNQQVVMLSWPALNTASPGARSRLALGRDGEKEECTQQQARHDCTASMRSLFPSERREERKEQEEGKVKRKGERERKKGKEQRQGRKGTRCRELSAPKIENTHRFRPGHLASVPFL